MKTIIHIQLSLLVICAVTLSQTQNQGKPSKAFGKFFEPKWARLLEPLTRTADSVVTESDDEATSVAFDSSGNILVTGWSSGSGSQYNIITIKYNATGTRQWSANFKGPDYYSRGTAIAADRSGNVYVAGEITSGMTGADYATIKYDSSGNVVWCARYDGPGHSGDVPTAIVVDESGNVFVTGVSIGENGSQDYATVKYNYQGTEEWVARYDHQGKYSVNYSYALAVDGNGNVYVTGYSDGRATTIKYNSVGVTQWIAAHDSAVTFALALDPQGNVYVTGSVASDYLTVKYDSSGKVVWENRYDGPGHNTDEAHAVVLDDSGNVYITGPSCGTNFTFNCATIKYNAAGDVQWIARYYGNGAFGSYGFYIGCDAARNIYVGGFSDGFGTEYDFIAIKYDPNGVQQWLSRYNGPANGTDYLNSMAVDNAGNVVVTGNSRGIDTYYDYATVKYDQNGVEQWSATYDGQGPRTTNQWIFAVGNPNGSVKPAGYVFVSHGADQTFSIQPDTDYHIDGVLVDGSYVGKDTSYTFPAVITDHTLIASFAINSNALRYRTLTYDSLIIKTPVKKKPRTEYWEFTLTNSSTTPVQEINIVFTKNVLAILGSGNLTSSGSGMKWKLTGTLLNGETLILKGRGVKPQNQTIAKLWFGPASGTPLKNILPTRQYPELPMPNAANVRVDAYAEQLFAGTDGLVVGIPLTSPHPVNGWVRMKTPNDFYKSLQIRALKHTNVGQGFDKFANYVPFRGEQRNLPPSRQNNRLFADLLALKFNIALSARGVTPSGLGEFRYSEPGNPCDGMLIRDIAHHVDSMMTFYVNDPPTYSLLDVALRNINAAFSGAIDTVNWSYLLTLKGTKRLRDVPFLSESGVPPTVLQPPSTGKQAHTTPDVMSLHQNYPNPFNPNTTISFELSQDALVTLKVYNIIGQEISTLVNGEEFAEGLHQVVFNAANLPSGIYLYKMVVRNSEKILHTDIRKMVVIK